ncbi:MAG: hypothetical protein PHS69_07330 [Firmicutes bacterium]|nr:hypothetical protein [Bacillota bacterium]
MSGARFCGACGGKLN